MKSHEVVLHCERCGREYTRHHKLADDSRFCSSTCQHGSSKLARVEKGSDEWLENRKAALQRDAYTCQNCGREVGRRDDDGVREAHVHHKLPLAFGGTHDLDNLETLCVNCHEQNSQIEIPEEAVAELRELVSEEEDGDE